MKKIMLVCTIFVFAMVGKVLAQGAGKVSTHDIHFNTGVKEGTNILTVPNGKGTVKLTRRGTVITNVVYTDAAGKTYNLQPSNGPANGAPQPNCKCPMPDACYGTADKSIGMCICKPTDLPNGDETYSIGLLLPAVQKVRDASTRFGSNNK